MITSCATRLRVVLA
ncbi:MAG: PTS transporter subunit EIIB [Candidatus Brockarchaeota archaeon]|nr:PTS transporter subunit EIIB [Candidatus Brockarchaeota archaeon]MBO3833205.1 PTS transporter subunit EIIB [Candidatus Brockarchaeota archaeon]MBO3841174.1 PTS transporter subunit EIIB [Candidatus Brockarchaeota archaeon]